MTRRKINIILSIFSVILAFSLFGFGVYASVAVTSTVNNTFIYEVPEGDFSAEIVGEITGASYEGLFLNHEKDSEITSYPNYYDVDFVEYGAGQYKDIVFTFHISNYNDFAITAVVESNTESQYFSSTPSSQVTIEKYYFDEVQQKWVAPEGEISLTLKLTTNNNFSKEPNSFTIKFEKV